MSHNLTNAATVLYRLALASILLNSYETQPIKQKLSKLFSDKYASGDWTHFEYIENSVQFTTSGGGSTLKETKQIREALPSLIDRYQIRRILDIPCGDFYWIRYTDLSNIERYTGADIVAQLIKRNNEKYANTTISFTQLDLTEDPLPPSDLVLCRDCLVHLTLDQAQAAITNIIASGAQFILLTHFPNVSKNNDIIAEQYAWRPLNLCKAPFNFPEPIELIWEGAEFGENASGKCLALWDLHTLANEK